jgi:hypothetical protein
MASKIAPALLVFGLALLATTTSSGCSPCSVFGPLQIQRDERELVLARFRGSRFPVELANVIAPPLTAAELGAVDRQNGSCRTLYMWKNALTWTGTILVVIAAGVTIGGAYATAIDDFASKIAFGVSAGSLATLGGVLEVLGDVVHQSFTERGCIVK